MTLRTAMKYLYHTKVMAEDEVPVGAHYRAREDMMNNVSFHTFMWDMPLHKINTLCP